MKKKFFLILLFLLFLVSCSKTTINAKMYQLKDWEYSEKVDDYKYEIFDTYSDYETSKNMPNLMRFFCFRCIRIIRKRRLNRA